MSNILRFSKKKISFNTDLQWNNSKGNNKHGFNFVVDRSFDFHKKNILQFKDILVGLAALEPSTQHGGMPAEVRCRYIFRFYDQNMDGFLQFEEFK